MKRVGVGVVGCGTISAAYLTAARKFPILEIVALADANPAAAEARAAEFGVRARSVDALLADPAVEIVLNLTVPNAHVEVGLKASGRIEFATADEDWREIPTRHAYADGNYRVLGAADMAYAIRSGRPHRASGALALHVLEVMEAFQASSDSGRAVSVSTRPVRPAPLPASLAVGELD